MIKQILFRLNLPPERAEQDRCVILIYAKPRSLAAAPVIFPGREVELIATL